MTTASIARSRSTLYQFLSDIFLHGMTSRAKQSLATVPQLPRTAPDSMDDWKALHYALFGLNVYPYETEFLTEDGTFGGKVTDTIARLYYEAAYIAYPDEPLDHIGNLLGFMAMVCAEEADALEDEVIQAVYHMTLLQRRCLNEHILCWLPMLTLAIHAQEDETFSMLADMTLQVTLSHSQQLGEDSARPTRSLQLPPAPNILDNPNTGFREIADYLLTPVYSAVYFSRDDIVRLSQSVGLPAGHGKRHMMLNQLFDGAIDADVLDDVLLAIQQRAYHWQTFYQDKVSLTRFADVWVDRLEVTLQFLQTIRDAL